MAKIIITPSKSTSLERLGLEPVILEEKIHIRALASFLGCEPLEIKQIASQEGIKGEVQFTENNGTRIFYSLNDFPKFASLVQKLKNDENHRFLEGVDTTKDKFDFQYKSGSSITFIKDES